MGVRGSLRDIVAWVARVARMPVARMPVAGILVAGVLAGFVAPLPVASAAPIVKVRARTEVVVDSVRRVDDGVEVHGSVTDLYSGEPITNVSLKVQINQRETYVETDNLGQFTARFYIEDGRHDVSVSFEDQEYYQGDSTVMSGVDVRKQNVELRVIASEVSYSNRTIEVTVRAVTEFGGQFVGAALSADVFAGPLSGELTRVASVSTDSNGRGTINLERTVLGAPGRKRVQVRFLGDRSFNPAVAQTDFLLATATAITIEVLTPSIAYEDELEARGRIVDDLGNPVLDAAVTLMVGTRRIAAAYSDDQGVFRMTADGDEFGAGTFNVQGVFEPTEPWYKPSRSEPAQVTVADPQPVPVSHTLAAFGATALAMVAFLGLRSKPWEAWLRRLRPRSDEKDKQDAANPAADPPPVRHGLQPARPSLVSSLRRPHEFDFSGTVRNAFRSRPVADATVTLEHTHGQGETRVTAVDDKGHFQFDQLEAGPWLVLCSAHGYVTERFGITLPHRGELRGVHIDLVPVRERIFAVYREVATPVLPRSELWGIWTPRQIFTYVRQKRTSPALSELTDFVEDAYFSQRVQEETVLPEAEAMVEHAREEIAPTFPRRR